MARGVRALGRQRGVPALRSRLVTAVAVATIVPALVLTLVIQRYALPAAGRHDVVVATLALSTILAMTMGGCVLWDIVRRLSRLAALVAERQHGVVEDHDDLAGLAASLSDAVSTVRDQSHEIESFGRRLTAVQAELETARRKLRASASSPEGWDGFTRHLEAITARRPASAKLVAR